VSIQLSELADGYTVPRIITGTWQLSKGHQAPRSRAEIFESFFRAIDSGITVFDCADIYTGIEEMLGDFLREYRQREGSAHADRIRIHTKFVPDLEALSTLDKVYVEKIIDRSLRRLGVEQLDLVQFSWWSYDIDRWIETAGWIEELRQKGKIRQIGTTNFHLESLRSMIDAGIPVRTHQIQYSALDHRPENGMVEYCRDNGIGIFCYGTLAGGFLSEHYLGTSDSFEKLKNRSLVKYRLIIDEYGGWERFQKLLKEMGQIARQHGVTIAQVALRYALDRPGVTAAIVGVSKAERISQIVKTFDLTLDDSQREIIHALGRTAPGPNGPVYGLEREKNSRHAAIMKYGLNRENLS